MKKEKENVAEEKRTTDIQGSLFRCGDQSLLSEMNVGLWSLQMLSLLIRALTGKASGTYVIILQWNSVEVMWQGFLPLTISSREQTRKAEKVLASDDPQSDRFQNHLKRYLLFYIFFSVYECTYCTSVESILCGKLERQREKEEKHSFFLGHIQMTFINACLCFSLFFSKCSSI